MYHELHRALKAAEARQYEGVTRHSKDDSYFIFCVGQDPIKMAAFISWTFYNKVNIKPLVGMYNGKSEHSFIANVKDYAKIEPFLINEESILVLDHFDARDTPVATLRYNDGRTVHLGQFKAVSKGVAHEKSSWTYDPLTKEYFVTA